MFGYIYAPDPRNALYGMSPVLASHIPDPITSLPNERIYATGPVLDQGDTRHCVGYAVAQWLVSEPLITHVDLSPDDLYHEAHRRDGISEPHEGTTLQGAMAYLRDAGRIAQYVWAHNAQTVAQWLIQGHGTVLLGTSWYQGMNSLDESGCIRADGLCVDGHAYLAIGYNQERQLVRIINSWGASWGDYGQAWLPLIDLDTLLQHGEACCGIEQDIT